MKRLLVPATATKRLAAFTGVLFFVLVLVAPEPNIGAERPSAEQVKQFYLENQQSFRASLLLVGLAYALFLCFLAVMRTELRRAEGGSGTLSALAMGSGLLLAGFSVLGNALHVVPAVVTADTDAAQAETFRVFGEEAFDTLVEASTFWVGVMMAAVSLVVLRQGGLPRWLGWSAAVIGAAALIGPIAFVESPVQPVMEALGFGSKIAFLFWILLASIALTVRAGRSSASQPSSRKFDSAGVQATS
jgi:hypothetical protein